MPPNLTQKYVQSDFVANITIIKIYPNKKNEHGYKADIKINELFKGEKLSSIYVYGRSDNGIGTSCDIFIPSGTKLIAYASKNTQGNFGIGMCSGLLYFKNKNSKRNNREIEILKLFKERGITFTDKINYREKATLNKELKQFKGIEVKNTFGIYAITFDSNLNIKYVSEISGFGTTIDKKLMEILKKTEWNSFNKGIQNKVPENSKLLIGIYYYPREKGNQSFLTHYFL